MLVIDGVPTDVPLNMINMDDVETVDVLKDASATAIYGREELTGSLLLPRRKGNRTPLTLTLRLLTVSKRLSVHLICWMLLNLLPSIMK